MTGRRTALALQDRQEAKTMKGTPRSLMLTWANSVAGWWTSAAVAGFQRQQRALLDAAVGAAMPKPARKRRRKRRRAL
jgi:hypothetical protein